MTLNFDSIVDVVFTTPVVDAVGTSYSECQSVQPFLIGKTVLTFSPGYAIELSVTVGVNRDIN